MSDLKDKSTFDLIGEIMAGTQVPRSMGVLGTAEPAWDELRSRLGVFGWAAAEDYANALRGLVVNDIVKGVSR